MKKCAVAINLKIPDNTAYTTLTTLQRLGVEVSRVDRSEILVIEWDREPALLKEKIERDEAIFNPNKHRLIVLDTVAPRAGEVWIEEAGRPGRFVGWRLIDESGKPASRALLAAAAERLLCNPAIETATFPLSSEAHT